MLLRGITGWIGRTLFSVRFSHGLVRPVEARYDGLLKRTEHVGRRLRFGLRSAGKRLTWQKMADSISTLGEAHKLSSDLVESEEHPGVC